MWHRNDGPRQGATLDIDILVLLSWAGNRFRVEVAGHNGHGEVAEMPAYGVIWEPGTSQLVLASATRVSIASHLRLIRQRLASHSRPT